MNKVAELLYKDPRAQETVATSTGRDHRLRRGPGGGLVLVLGPLTEPATMTQAMRGGW
jgi:hypothetical protein